MPPIHIQLAERLDLRLGPGTAGTYMPGDRVQFVVTEQREPGQKTSACGEDPDYGWTHGLPLSRDHYVEKAVKNTFARILDPVLVGPGLVTRDANSRKRDASRVFEDFLRGGARGLRRQRPPVPAGGRGGLMALATMMKRCELCGAPTTAAGGICGSHSPAELAAHARRDQAVVDGLQADRAKLWRTCQACVAGFDPDKDPDRAARLPAVPDIESLERATPCPNNTCHIYWERRSNDRQSGAERR